MGAPRAVKQQPTGHQTTDHLLGLEAGGDIEGLDVDENAQLLEKILHQ